MWKWSKDSKPTQFDANSARHLTSHSLTTFELNVVVKRKMTPSTSQEDSNAAIRYCAVVYIYVAVIHDEIWWPGLVQIIDDH